MNTYVRNNNEIDLSFVLHSPNERADFYYETVPGPNLNTSVERYRYNLFRKIESLLAGIDTFGQVLSHREVGRKLEGIGQNLFYEIFSKEMRGAYRRFRRVRTLQIISDEPWIPWELIKPFDDTDPSFVIDDDFLCSRFQLTRWLAGGRPGGRPAQAIHVNKVACILASKPPDRLGLKALPYAEMERKILARMACDLDLVDDSPDPADYQKVEHLLETGGTELVTLGGWKAVRATEPQDPPNCE